MSLKFWLKIQFLKWNHRLGWDLVLSSLWTWPGELIINSNACSYRRHGPVSEANQVRYILGAVTSPTVREARLAGIKSRISGPLSDAMMTKLHSHSIWWGWRWWCCGVVYWSGSEKRIHSEYSINSPRFREKSHGESKTLINVVRNYDTW